MSDRPLCEVLLEISHKALMENRPPPVIETDMETARLLEKMLGNEMGWGWKFPLDHPERAFGVVAMFDGVKIKGKR